MLDITIGSKVSRWDPPVSALPYNSSSQEPSMGKRQQRAKALKAGAIDRRGGIGRWAENMVLSEVVQATSNYASRS